MRSLPDDPNDRDGFVHIRQVVNAVTKEIARRFEFRNRLEAERGKPVSDEEFLCIAEESSGIRI